MNIIGERSTLQRNGSDIKSREITRNDTETEERICRGKLVHQQELDFRDGCYHRQIDNSVNLHNRGSVGRNATDIDEGVGGLVSRGETQKAKEKRTSYRTKASGYGTESSQGSCDKSQERFENDVFEDIYTACRKVDALSNPFGQESAHPLGATTKALINNSDSFSEKGSLTCSSSNSNNTVIDTLNLSAASSSLPGVNHQRKILWTEKENRASQNQMANAERLLSDQELSFEILLSANDDACSAKNVKDEVPQSESTDFSSLFEGNVALLRKYISEQQNAPRSETPVSIEPNEIGFNQELVNPTNEPIQADIHELFLSSMRGFDDGSFCSIVPSNDAHIPLNEIDRMFSSAMRRLDKQTQQQDLQKVFAVLDEEDTVDNIFQELEKLGLDSDQNSKDSIKTGNIFWHFIGITCSLHAG